MKRLLSLGLLCASTVLFSVGCGPEGGNPDGGPDGGGDGGGQGTDGGDGGNNCTPLTCDETAGCGTYSNGCDGTLTCSNTCGCTEGNFETACAPKPCQTVTGCSETGICEYAPVVCGAATCAPSSCTGEGCDEVCTTDTCTNALYPCGEGVCASVTEYCDPRPTISGTSVVYANACVGPPERGCGTCELGVRACDSGNDRFTCNSPPNPVEDSGGTVECDSTKAGSTYVYLDTQYTGGGNVGSKEKPFTTYSAALSSAQSRGARGIVVAGSPVFTEPLLISDGISIYGGFGASPRFDPDRNHRPKWDIGTGHYNGSTNQLVGATAQDVTNGAVLFHLEIKAADVTFTDANGNGASSIALVALNSPGLKLDDMFLTSGRGSAGTTGTSGTASGASKNGLVGSGRSPGAAGPECAATCTVDVPFRVAYQGSDTCGYGGHYQTGAGSSFWKPTARGNPGTPNQSVVGGPAGNSMEEGGCDGSRSTQVTSGQSGANGFAGPSGSNGVRGAGASLNASGVYLPNPGSNGTPGQAGTWGGGGGSGGGFRDDCSYAGDSNSHLVGRAGGGGGGPGCGGDFGRRGGGGGASIAVVAAGTTLSVANTHLTTGSGGNGGGGGQGAAGGTGGPGVLGVGMDATGCTIDNTNSNPTGMCGGNGGRGGNGGNGGHAGGGSGGHSVGIWCVGNATLTRTGVDFTTGTAGNGGTAALGALQGVSGASAQMEGCP